MRENWFEEREWALGFELLHMKNAPERQTWKSVGIWGFNRYSLFSEAEFFDKNSVLFDVGVLDIIKEASSASYED